MHWLHFGYALYQGHELLVQKQYMNQLQTTKSIWYKLCQHLARVPSNNPTLLTGLLLNSHWHVLKCCLEISTAVLFCYTPSFKCSSIAPALYLSTEGDYWIPFINRTTTAHKYPHRRAFSTLNKWTERNWAVFPGEGATRARGSKRQWDILAAKT